MPDKPPCQNLISSVYLQDQPLIHKENSKPLYQFVYASQLNHTFFSVFANFKSKQKDKNTRMITDVDFHIFNYKGPFNFGIANVDFDYGSKTFKVTVQAMLVNNSTRSCENFKGFEVKKGEHVSLVRSLVPCLDTPGVFDEEFFIRNGDDDPRVRTTLRDEITEISTDGKKTITNLTAVGCRCETSNIVFNF